jgi:RNA polymerase sigma-70 factor (ECF subfamily)
MTDADLLRSALEGDRAAFADLYDRHAGAVFGYALRIVGDRPAAEDATQEAFLALFRGRSYDASRPFAAWLLTLTRHASIDVLRRRRPEVAIDRELMETTPARPVEPGVREEVERALCGLPAEFREALWLCDALELSYREAAEIMGCEVNTVGTRLSRGRQQLRTLFTRNGHAVR